MEWRWWLYDNGFVECFILYSDGDVLEVYYGSLKGDGGGGGGQKLYHKKVYITASYILYITLY
jgi:hypothetical protein